MTVVYSIWRDSLTSDVWEVVRYAGGMVDIVQTNIRTREKAEKACKDWQKREAEKITKAT